jgi:hypothetical protein
MSLCLSACLGVAGCSAVLDGDGGGDGMEPVVSPPAARPEDPPSEDPPPSGGPPVEAPVFAKNGEQLRVDLATALALAPAEVCAELGDQDCVDVHRIVLGGVEPYALRIDEPLAEPSPTTPLAMERLAWGACKQAVARDLGPGPPVVLVQGTGGLDRPASARGLAERLLHRRPEEAQVATLAEFGPELDDEAWAMASCVAVASSFEATFY